MQSAYSHLLLYSNLVLILSGNASRTAMQMMEEFNYAVQPEKTEETGSVLVDSSRDVANESTSLFDLFAQGLLCCSLKDTDETQSQAK